MDRATILLGLGCVFLILGTICYINFCLQGKKIEQERKAFWDKLKQESTWEEPENTTDE